MEQIWKFLQNHDSFAHALSKNRFTIVIVISQKLTIMMVNNIKIVKPRVQLGLYCNPEVMLQSGSSARIETMKRFLVGKNLHATTEEQRFLFLKNNYYNVELIVFTSCLQPAELQLPPVCLSPRDRPARQPQDGLPLNQQLVPQLNLQVIFVTQ